MKTITMDTEKICEVIHHHLSEMTDGYVVIGFNADNGEPFVRSSLPDVKTALAINALLKSIVDCGGVPADYVKKEGGKDGVPDS